ncbi:MAG: YqjF family protein [Planctomycetota bacterium]
MPHPALKNTDHIPLGLCQGRWALTMRWEQLLFLHWRVGPAEQQLLARGLPEGLELDTFDGSAWLAVVPFVMASTRFRWLPPMPTASSFPECNLRTYVRHGDRRGVWFYSLDAHSRMAVEGARLGFGLPYFRARMSLREAGGRVHYASERTDRRAPPAVFRASWQAAGAATVAERGSLEEFLTARYSLFAMRRGKLVRGDIAHQPWRLAPVDLQLEECDMARLVDVSLAGPPESALLAAPVDVAAWSPVRG